MFDFNVWHVFDKRYIAADELFRRLCKLSNNIDEVHKKNIDDFIDDQFNCVRIYSMRINKNDDEQSLKNEYFKKFQRIIHYLITLARSSYLNRKKFRKFKNWVLQFFVRDRHLFKRVNKNVLLRKVINKAKNWIIILKQFHDENEHRKRERAYRRVTNKCWWRNFYWNCEKHCQRTECKFCVISKHKQLIWKSPKQHAWERQMYQV